MTLAPPISPIADVVADLLRHIADAISPPRANRLVAPPAAAKPRLRPAPDSDRDRAMLSAAFKHLPAHLRRDIGIDV
jgi:hypothetical protein